jgi:hypothetical protein
MISGALLCGMLQNKRGRRSGFDQAADQLLATQNNLPLFPAFLLQVGRLEAGVDRPRTAT